MKAKSPESSAEVISAQVILRRRDSQQPVTAETIRALAPDPQAVRKAMRWFEAHGFQVGEFVGTSFSITASREHFQKVLGGKIPAAIRPLIEAISATDPPDFGPPGGYA